MHMYAGGIDQWRRHDGVGKRKRRIVMRKASLVTFLSPLQFWSQNLLHHLWEAKLKRLETSGVEDDRWSLWDLVLKLTIE